MKLGAIALMFVVPMVIDPGVVSHRATPQDYREILKMLAGVEDRLETLADAVHDRAKDEKPDCRGLSPEKTVRCAAHTFGVSEEQAVSVWQCESNFGTEPPHTDAYHGPFQYLYSTYASQQASMPDVVDWYELSPAVHDMRSNILTAVAWAARNSWSPWSCAA